MRTIQSRTMMKMAAIALLLFAASACKKDDPAPAPTKEQLLANAKGWMRTGESMVIDGQTTSTDLFALINDCVKDNVIKFTADGTISIDEGANKCGSTQTVVGTWILNSDKSKLTMKFVGADPNVLIVDILSATTLKLTNTEATIPNIQSLNYPKGIVTSTFTAVK